MCLYVLGAGGAIGLWCINSDERPGLEGGGGFREGVGERREPCGGRGLLRL